MAFQGSLKELPLPDIVQLVSVSGKTGVFNLKNGATSGEIYLRDGQIVHAKAGNLEGEEAVYELAVWNEGEFVFHPGKTSPASTIKRSNTNLLMEAARRIDEWQVLGKRIPSTRLVPIFTNQAKKTSVSLSPAEWGLISKIDERRSIEEIALALGESPFDVCKLLYGMITSGLIALDEDFSRLAVERLQKLSNEDAGALLEQVHQAARGMLAAQGAAAQPGSLDAPYRLSQAELAGGRKVDALLDLVRAEEKVLAAELGAAQGKAFLDRVTQLLAAR
jgi:Domain of unknown function (DUF4388)